MFDEYRVTDEVKAERLSICELCEHNKLGICSQCGCILHLKTEWKGVKCPIDKWDKVTD